jgi:2-polyprenyl-3-methyl-5-hydroxy-6-metoxy-1,4-benzoquinol methylase
MGTMATRPSREYLRDLMLAYQVKNLTHESPSSFKQRIDQFLGLSDYKMEGLDAPDSQRNLTTDFRWGHDHDFGTFKLQGKMRSRHVEMLAEFIDGFKAMPLSLSGKRVIEIGCWTGGTSLLLSAMGAEVLAIDEVKKYVDSLRYLKEAFSITNLEVEHRSLYDLTAPELQDRFDYVMCEGVMYHVTDPVVALRIMFNMLRDGGKLLIETTGFRRRQPVLSFARRKWNWFDFSPAALSLMLRDVGFAEIDVGKVTLTNRLFAVAQRQTHVPMRRDGLSVRTLR